MMNPVWVPDCKPRPGFSPPPDFPLSLSLSLSLSLYALRLCLRCPSPSRNHSLICSISHSAICDAKRWKCLSLGSKRLERFSIWDGRGKCMKKRILSYHLFCLLKCIIFHTKDSHLKGARRLLVRNTQFKVLVYEELFHEL
ncbi:hypothetical protein I3843_08G172400 [Carya illinoinensis]|nr:hypothetical protein I3843_08G172400 [Carya illinoinensis]